MSYLEEGCLFHGYARWYAAAAGSLIPLSYLPILGEANQVSDDAGRREWTLWELSGGLAALGAYLGLSLVVLLVATTLRPAPRSGRRVVVIAGIAALLAALLLTTPTTDEPLTGAGKAAAAVLIITAVLAGDHALHLIRYRRREREPMSSETT